MGPWWCSMCSYLPVSSLVLEPGDLSQTGCLTCGPQWSVLTLTSSVTLNKDSTSQCLHKLITRLQSVLPLNSLWDCFKILMKIMSFCSQSSMVPRMLRMEVQPLSLPVQVSLLLTLCSLQAEGGRHVPRSYRLSRPSTSLYSRSLCS